jgi:hypothetical protein
MVRLPARGRSALGTVREPRAAAIVSRCLSEPHLKKIDVGTQPYFHSTSAVPEAGSVEPAFCRVDAARIEIPSEPHHTAPKVNSSGKWDFGVEDQEQQQI